MNFSLPVVAAGGASGFLLPHIGPPHRGAKFHAEFLEVMQIGLPGGAASSRVYTRLWIGGQEIFDLVLRQNLVRAENGLIPRGNDLHTTRELNQRVFLIA